MDNEGDGRAGERAATTNRPRPTDRDRPTEEGRRQKVGLQSLLMAFFPLPILSPARALSQCLNLGHAQSVFQPPAGARRYQFLISDRPYP